jgi:ABC-type transporter Mla subunit MlaD
LRRGGDQGRSMMTNGQARRGTRVTAVVVAAVVVAAGVVVALAVVGGDRRELPSPGRTAR